MSDGKKMKENEEIRVKKQKEEKTKVRRNSDRMKNMKEKMKKRRETMKKSWKEEWKKE